MAKATSPRKPRQTPASAPATAPATTVAATPATPAVAAPTQPQVVLLAVPPANVRGGTARAAAYAALLDNLNQPKAVVAAAVIASETQWAISAGKPGASKSANAAGWFKLFGAVFGAPTTQPQVSA